MRKLLTFLIALGAIVFAIGPSLAQVGGLSFPGPFIGGPFIGGYTGPNDAVSGAKEIWAFRCGSSALATGTTKIVNVTRASDSTSTDIVCLSNGAADIATATTFCASTTCKVGTFYGQLGFSNMTQATSASRPTLTFNAIGTKMCLKFDSAGEILNATTSTQAQPLTIAAVAERTANFTAPGAIFESANNDTGLSFNSAANQAGIIAGSVLVGTASDSNPHAIIGVANGASSAVYIDGTPTTGNAGTAGFTGTLRMGTGFADLTGIVCEVDLYYSGLNSTQAGALNTNMHGSNGYGF